MAGPLMHEVDVEASPETIYEALTTGAGLASFWTRDSRAEPKVGSVARFGFGSDAVLEMKIEELRPGRLVAWSCAGRFPTWTGTRVSWQIGDGPDARSIVLFKHEGWDEGLSADDLASVNYVWGQVVARLKEYAESGQPKPEFG